MTRLDGGSNPTPTTAPTGRTRRWLLTLVALVALVEITYVLSANALLRGDALLRLLNRDPDRLSVEWSNGWSLIPGRISVENLELAGRTEQQSWRISAAAAEIRVSLWPLPFKILHVGLLRADRVAAGLRTLRRAPRSENDSQLSEPDPPLSAPGARAAASTASEPPPANLPLPWTIEIEALELSHVQELKLDKHRLVGDGGLEGEQITLQRSGVVAIARAKARLGPSSLTLGPESIAQELQFDADLRLDPLEVRNTRLPEAARALSGTAQISGRAASYGFFERVLTGARGVRLDGHGDMRATLNIEAGRLVEGSEIAVDSPRLAVELDAPVGLGKGGRYRVEGAGKTTSSVFSADDGASQTRLQVELRDMQARRGTDAPVLLQGRIFRLTATGPPIEFGSPYVESSVVIELDDTLMPDVVALNDYFPGETPFSLASGSARLTGRMEYADKVVTGTLRLSGERIAGQVFGQAVRGELGVDLVIRQADFRKTRLDLSGSRIHLQAARDDTQEASPLSTEIRVLEARLAVTGDENAVVSAAMPPPFDGVVRLEGSIANTEFLSAFLPDGAGLEVSGDGRITAELRVEAGRLAPGSRAEVTSERLVSRFLGLEATGSGVVQAEIRSADTNREALVQVGLSDMKVLRLSDGKPLLQGDALELIASGHESDEGAMPANPSLMVAWRNAVVPDVAVLDTYLAGQKAFALRSGVARASGRLEYAGDILSGNLDLAGERIEGTILREPVTGRLDLSLVIARADLSARRLDLSGTRLRMQAASRRKGKKGVAPLQTEIRFPRVQLESELPFTELREHAGPPPVSGELKVEGTVANIDFINRFLSGKQRLGFHGGGTLSADLRLSTGRLAPGSALEIRSSNLASRFLDFEAEGAGLLKARVSGRRRSPGADIDVAVSNFQLRRLDETTPYVRGKRLDLKTSGSRLDKDNILRELSTDIQLWGAELPDMTVYNRYLPPKSGIAIVSGKGVVEGGFDLKGASGSGDLQLRAKGVVVRIQDQTLKGDLLIYTRLRDGNLDTMTFDASGTRVRLDKASLVMGEGTSAHNWWGQIDLAEGRMIWEQPLQLDARVGLQLRDSGLLVNLFVKKGQHQEWLSKLLTIKNVTGEGRVRIRDDSLTLQDARIAGQDFLVLANARLRGERVDGGLYAKYGVLSGGVELAGDEPTWRLFDAREWFDAHARAFSASNP